MTSDSLENLAKIDRRNKFEYEGVLNVDERLLAESIGLAEKMLALLEKR